MHTNEGNLVWFTQRLFPCNCRRRGRTIRDLVTKCVEPGVEFSSSLRAQNLQPRDLSSLSKLSMCIYIMWVWQ